MHPEKGGCRVDEKMHPPCPKPLPYKGYKGIVAIRVDVLYKKVIIGIHIYSTYIHRLYRKCKNKSLIHPVSQFPYKYQQFKAGLMHPRINPCCALFFIVALIFYATIEPLLLFIIIRYEAIAGECSGYS